MPPPNPFRSASAGPPNPFRRPARPAPETARAVFESPSPVHPVEDIAPEMVAKIGDSARREQLTGLDRVTESAKRLGKQAAGHVADMAVTAAGGLEGMARVAVSGALEPTRGKPLGEALGDVQASGFGEKYHDKLKQIDDAVGTPETAPEKFVRTFGPETVVGIGKGLAAGVERQVAKRAANAALVGDLSRVEGAQGVARAADEQAAGRAVEAARGRAAEADRIHGVLNEEPSPTSRLLREHDQRVAEAQVDAPRKSASEAQARMFPEAANVARGGPRPNPFRPRAPEAPDRAVLKRMLAEGQIQPHEVPPILKGEVPLVPRAQKFNAEFLTKAFNAEDGAELGTLGDFLVGPKVRALYADVLNVPVRKLSAPPAGAPPGTEFHGGFGTYDGRPTLFVSGRSGEHSAATLLEEAAHAMRVVGRGRVDVPQELGGAFDFGAYRALPAEQSAERMVQHALALQEDPIHVQHAGVAGERGAAAAPVVGGLAGGTAGAAYGAGQGDTPGERVKNAALYGLAGAAGGAVAGKALESVTSGRLANERGAVSLRPAPSPVRAQTVDELIGESKASFVGAPTPTHGAAADDFANIRSFALDPTGEARLRATVERVAEATGLHPKTPVTWEQTQRIAQSMGVDIDAATQGAGRLGGPEMLAIREVVRQNIDEMTKLSQQVAQGGLPAEAADHAAQVLAGLDRQNASLLERFMRNRSSTGRDLNALKILANRSLDPSLWLVKARQLAGEEGWTEGVRTEVARLANAQDRAGLVRYLMGLRRATTAEKVVTYYKANLLTNPLTHIRNVAGNTTMAVLEATKDAPAALADRLMSLATGTRTVSGPSALAARASLQGARQGLREARLVMRGVPMDEALTKFDIPHEINFDNVLLDTYTKTVFRALGAEDRVFRGAAMRGSLANQAQVLAKAEGLSGRALRDRAAQLVAQPTDEMALRAIQDASEATFQDQTGIGKALGGIQKLSVRSVPVGQFVVPFARTPGAVATRAVEYSPLGLAGGVADVGRVVVRAMSGKGVPPGLQRQAARLFGRGATGSALVAAGYLLQQNGRAVGAMPDTEAGKAEAYLEGKKPNSILVGDQWVNIGQLGPLGSLVALGANLAQSVGKAPDAVGAAGGAVGSLVTSVTDQPFLTGLRQVMDLRKDPVKKGGEMLTNTATGFVPAAAAVAAVARGTDPTMRQPTDTREVFASRLPFASHSAPPRLDQFGRPVKREGGLVGALLNPVPTSTDQTQRDPVVKALADAGYDLSDLGRRRGESDDVYRQRQQVTGQVLRETLGGVVAHQGFAQLRPEAKQVVIDRLVDRVRARVGATFPRPTPRAGRP